MMQEKLKNQEAKPKIGLALGGGAARGFCHIGVLKVIEELQIPIHCVAGCSMGAVVGACWAIGVSISEMEAMAERISDFVIRDFYPSGKRQGFFKGGRVLKVIRNILGEKTFADCHMPFAATAVDIKKAELCTFTEGELTAALRASISVPGVFHAAEIDGNRYIDGNVLERIPIPAARALGAEIVIAVDAIGPARTDYEPKGIFDMFERMVIVMDWALNKDRIESGCDILITPDQGDRSMQKFKNNAQSILAGETAAREVLQSAKAKEILSLYM